MNAEICEWGRHRVMRLIPDDLNTSLKVFKEQKADGISLSSRDGCSSETFDILSQFVGLKILLVRGLSNIRMDVLRSLPELEEISTDAAVRGLDLALLPGLRRLTGDWNEKFILNSKTSNITSLRISKFKSTSGNLIDFPFFPKLLELELVQSSIDSLKGISKFSDLERMEVHYMPKLESLGELRLPKLRVFIASMCKKISDHEQLGACESLEEIKLHDCGKINSLSFLSKNKKLKSFRFMRTDVSDGELSILLRLDDVYFTEKKHFSHKTSDMRQST